MIDPLSQKIYAFALLKLSANDIPEKQLQEKLVKKFCTQTKTMFTDIEEIQEKILEILSVLRSQKYIDDRRFAENFIRWRKETMPRGKYMIMQELVLKKIDRSLAEELCEKNISYHDEYKMCEFLFTEKLQKLENKYIYTSQEYREEKGEEIQIKIKQKLFQFLAGKQFSYSLMQDIWEKNVNI